MIKLVLQKTKRAKAKLNLSDTTPSSIVGWGNNDYGEEPVVVDCMRWVGRQ